MPYVSTAAERPRPFTRNARPPVGSGFSSMQASLTVRKKRTSLTEPLNDPLAPELGDPLVVEAKLV